MKTVLKYCTRFTISTVLSVLLNNVYAQVANYAFTQEMGTYVPIDFNTDPSWTGVVPRYSGSSGSSTRINNIGLPFSFCYQGVSYDVLSMHSNGYLQFTNSISPSSISTPISSLNNVISGFGTDLETSGSSSMGARLTGIQVGTAPFRYLTFQWGNAAMNSFWKRTGITLNERIHFQIVLYETTNVIEFRYYIEQARPSSAITGVQVGLRGSSSADFNNRSMSSNTLWLNNNSAGASINSTMLFGDGVNVKPNHNPSGLQCLVFRWTPVGGPSADPEDISGCYFSPLPVDLTNFNVNASRASNHIYWSTASEENSDYFEVERSLDGEQWSSIGRVLAAGNSTTERDYSLEDKSFDAEINYYRLKQVDYDGTTKIYQIVSADNRDKNREVIKVTNAMGQEVNKYFRGVVIEIYSDGTTRRLYRN
jgi:hypothetical protein